MVAGTVNRVVEYLRKLWLWTTYYVTPKSYGCGWINYGVTDWYICLPGVPEVTAASRLLTL